MNAVFHARLHNDGFHAVLTGAPIYQTNLIWYNSSVRNHPHLYEISAWPWLEQLSRARGSQVTLDNVHGGAWDWIARQGMDCVYLMGVWQRSAVGRLMGRVDSALVSEYDRVLPG